MIDDVGEEGRRHLIVVKMLGGQTLPRRSRGRPFDTEHLLDMGMQVADALDDGLATSVQERKIQ